MDLTRFHGSFEVQGKVILQPNVHDYLIFFSYRRPVPSIHCKKGYYSDGYRCRDVDECKSYPPKCGKNSKCTNYLGTFRCHCQWGHSGSPPRIPCQDVDECSTGVHRCYENSVCKNFKGGYWCDCSALGFTWDGEACICKEGFKIREDGRCVEIKFSDEEDICGEGYQGNPPVTPFRDPHSNCTDTNGTLSCVCNPGHYHQ